MLGNVGRPAVQWTGNLREGVGCCLHLNRDRNVLPLAHILRYYTKEYLKLQNYTISYIVFQNHYSDFNNSTKMYISRNEILEICSSFLCPAALWKVTPQPYRSDLLPCPPTS